MAYLLDKSTYYPRIYVQARRPNAFCFPPSDFILHLMAPDARNAAICAAL